MDISRELAANVAQIRFESLDREFVEKAKIRILDTIGCIVAGAESPGCRMMLNLIRKWGGAKESTLIAYGGRVPAHNAAMMNGLLARSCDFEPVEAEGKHKGLPSHISGTTVPTALAMAEQQAAGGKDLITALVAGDDLAARLAVASGFDPSLGWDNTGTVNLFGAAAIAGKLLKLDERQIFNAFGIALNQLAGCMAGCFDKTMTFKLPIALSGRNGIFAAELAQQGFDGVKEPFLGPRGYFSLFCTKSNIEDLKTDLGKRFYADCVIKPYSACRTTHPSIECALEIVRRNDIKAEDIEEIAIHVAPSVTSGFCGQAFTGKETPQVDAAYSIRYAAALAFLKKDVKPEGFTDEYLRNPKIDALIGKMTLTGSIPQEKAPAAEIRVKMKDGQMIASHVDVPKGDMRKTPLTADEIKAKYLSNMDFSRIVSRKNAQKAMDVIEKLEEVKDVGKLSALLVKDK
jgi:2-methylcitrate dehydratase PrpD